MAVELVAQLNEEQNKAFSRMLYTIREKQRTNQLLSEYRESKNRLDKIGFSIPPDMIDFASCIGWADKTVKVPGRRIQPDGFILGRSSRLLTSAEEYMMDPHFQNIERMAVDASLEHSVSFMFTSAGDESIGEPEVITVGRTALESTCEIDRRTGRTTAALDIVEPGVYTLYLPGETFRIEMKGNRYTATDWWPGIQGRVTVTPYIWGKSLKRPFGRSRITKPLMSFIDTGIRSMLREEVQAEFFSFPQRGLLGADEMHFTDAEGRRITPLQAIIGGLWALPDVRDEETGDLVRADLTQLAQASFQPHEEMLRGLASRVSGETSIPVGYLGVIHDNPSSADAIRASESDLVSVVMDELASYGSARANVARDVAAIQEGNWSREMEKELRGLQSNFKNPGTPTKSEQADAGLKYVQAFPESDPRVAMEIYGLTRDQIDRNMKYRETLEAKQTLMDILGTAQKQPGEEGEQPADDTKALPAGKKAVTA